MKNEKKKKSSLPSILFAVFILLAANVSMEEEIFLPIIAIALIGIVFWIFIGKGKTKSQTTGFSSKSKTAHSHDRLTVTREELMQCDGLEHYKIQLDGFMAAGIIDRKEYNVLMDKYRKQLGNKI